MMLVDALDEKRLQVISAVVDAQGVRAASERLGLDPSVVSRHVAEAEKRLGVDLFDRVGRQMRPNQVGLMIAAFARERAVLADDLMARIDAVKDVRAGTVTIATAEGFLLDLLGGPLAKYQAQYPDVMLTVETMTIDTMVAALADDLYEIGIAHNPDIHPALRRVHSRILPIDLIVHRDHALAKRVGPVEIAEIAACRCALLKHGFGLQKAVEVIEYTEKVKFRPSLITNSLNGLKGFVLSGQGVVMMPSIVVKSEIKAGSLVALKINNPITANAEMHLLVRRGRRLSPASSRALVEMTRYMSAMR
jgi:DNA-binding transcriptional LysR family regulator